MSEWNVSAVTSLYRLIVQISCKETFNEAIGAWDVSSVTTMEGMFGDAHAFNQRLDWDVSSVTNMEYMFNSAYDFNQPLEWDVSSVTSMTFMFYDAHSFNHPLIWDTNAVTNMQFMFYNARAFNQRLDWHVFAVTNMLVRARPHRHAIRACTPTPPAPGQHAGASARCHARAPHSSCSTGTMRCRTATRR